MKPNTAFTILLTSSPQSEQIAIALNFCKAIIDKSKKIGCLFLQNDAVYLAQNNYTLLEDEKNISLLWQEFLQTHQIPAYVCSNSAVRRGIYNKHFAELYKRSENIAPMFKIVALGSLYTSMAATDRFIRL